MKRISISFLLMLMLSCGLLAQTKKTMTLQEVIETASQQSLDAFINKNMYLSSYWEFRYYKADRLPSLTLDATPFNYNRSVQKVYNYDENRDEFVERESFDSDLSLLLNQNVGLTGGSFFVQSNLSMTQKLGNDELSSFTSTPFMIGYSQNINGYNQLKWKSRIEPVKFEKAKKQFIQDHEDLSIKATRLFFDLLDAQIEVKISETNLANADTLYNIGKGRFQVGTVTQDELLDLELSYMNAQLALTKAKLALDRAEAQLNSFLGLDKNTQVECIIPEELPQLQIDALQAVDKAMTNNPDIINQQQRLLTQDQNVKRAQSENGISGDVFALYGLNQNSENFDGVYKDPLDQQRLRIGVNIPILDWGRRKGQLLMAKSNREAVRLSINQEKIDFEQNIIMNVMEFNLQDMQVENSAKADTIAKMRYDVTQQRFLIGKQDITRLNIARTERDQAHRAYIAALRTYWNYYYNIRYLTLFDFEKNVTLSEDFDQLVENY
ncbi:TolC family protein [Maribellus sediminis]|uniref:TolC family protein n=1 Tax=Maribellus sediminis TaxID=2696285 RepID=UPI001430C46C|nr:TolC family protein [Maribellus sediminis]